MASVAVLGIATMSGCASDSVAQAGGGNPSSSSGPAADFSSIIPSGDIVAASKEIVEKSLTASDGFTPLSTGPTAQKGKTIAFVGADLTNGGINTVAEGMKEPIKAIGWTMNVYDGKATVQGHTDAIHQAIASHPDAIVLGGVDATEQASSVKEASDAGIPLVGWHSADEVGAVKGLFDNISTDPLVVAQLAAAYAVADSDGKAGVAIFRDSQYSVAVRKAEAMAAYVRACSGCSVLEEIDSPIAESDSRMPGVISNLLQQYGDKLNYLLAINGNYYGGAQQALRAAGKDPAGPPKAIAAGDGDAAEFQRIRDVDYQAVTVAEPLLLQSWQIVDELNRALSGESNSGFVAAPGLVDKSNVPQEGSSIFDPKSGYRDVYKKVWGVK
ncbi:substrate-binding domain-containing protein [Galbitalea sp. SE-J8]|uniref:substrate-binding domain-containing protein n=1 Tax=Galbitalea sp. SE-J8 TaxID=3054952 RepID=UPI00259D0897|nr:substrate-binding domain-containing protein [Galbitalea sp. SE-J8]